MNEMRNNYQKNILNETFNVQALYTIHYFKYGKNFSCGYESHDFWEMVYIDSGEAHIVADDKDFTLMQGQAYFHKPNEMHTIYTTDDFANSVIVSFECVSPAMMEIFAQKTLSLDDFEKQLLNKIVYEAKLSYKEKLNDIYLEKMTKRENAPFAGEQLIKNSIELLLISLRRNSVGYFDDNINIENEYYVNGVVNSAVYSDKIAEKIIAILKDSIYDKIDLNIISKKIAFSKTYIKSVFKKETKTSIIQYYISLKIDEAKKLISQKKYTITEISDILRFNSVHYFSRQFKLHTDMSPTEYANSIKVDNVLK